MSTLEPLSAAVSGSFRRHLDEVAAAVLALEQAGARVLSPRSTMPAAMVDGFVVLSGDTGSPREIQERHLAAIAAADFLWLVCPDGYVGASALLEVGYARALGVPVFAAREPEERVAAEQVGVSEDLPGLVSRLAFARGQAPPEVHALGRLQRWSQAMVVARGFADETLEELLLLLIEEVGELVAAARLAPEYEAGRFAGLLDGMEELAERARQERKQGVAVATTRGQAGVASELADLEIYLAVIANKTGVELAEAIRRKVTSDRDRHWS